MRETSLMSARSSRWGEGRKKREDEERRKGREGGRERKGEVGGGGEEEGCLR